MCALWKTKFIWWRCEENRIKPILIDGMCYLRQWIISKSNSNDIDVRKSLSTLHTNTHTRMHANLSRFVTKVEKKITISLNQNNNTNKKLRVISHFFFNFNCNVIFYSTKTSRDQLDVNYKVKWQQNRLDNQNYVCAPVWSTHNVTRWKAHSE